jgi:hypothetical protein
MKVVSLVKIDDPIGFENEFFDVLRNASPRLFSAM